MMNEAYSPLLQQLIAALQCLPGVGQKSAQRMAFHLLQRDSARGKVLASAMARALDALGNCERCRMLTEEPICRVCSSPRRSSEQLCVVEMPADLVAIEQAGIYSGRYFVLMGHLSPIDGIGPAELGLDLFEQRLKDEPIDEVVLATSVTVEGDATAHLLAEIAQHHSVRASRIAYGVPVGGELEYIDSGTLSRAFNGRLNVESADSSEF